MASDALAWPVRCEHGDVGAAATHAAVRDREREEIGLQ